MADGGAPDGKPLVRSSTLDDFLKTLPAIPPQQQLASWKPRILTDSSTLLEAGGGLMKGVSANFMNMRNTSLPTSKGIEGQNSRDWFGDVTIIKDKISTGVKGKLLLRGEQLVLTAAAPLRGREGHRRPAACDPTRAYPACRILCGQTACN
jgi:hypothetical protein